MSAPERFATPPERLAAPRSAAFAGYVAVLSLMLLLTGAWLVVGVLVAVAAHEPRVVAPLPAGWAAAVLAAAPRSEGAAQAWGDGAASAGALVVAVVVARSLLQTWTRRLLVLALVGASGAFDLQAHAAAGALRVITRVDVEALDRVVLHGVACAAYLLALLLFPTGRWSPRTSSPVPLAALVAAAVVLVVGTDVLPHTTICILFFSVITPVGGIAALAPRTWAGASQKERAQARLALAVLAAALVATAVLGLVTVLLRWLAQPGLGLHDPTSVVGQVPVGPAALLFWFSRVVCGAVPLALVRIARQRQPWAAERDVSRALAGVFVVVVTGGAFVVARAVVERLEGPRGTAWVPVLVAAVAAGALVRPVGRRVGALADRLLYGRRPTPYRVLADVMPGASVPVGSGALAQLTERAARAMQARWCELVIALPGGTQAVSVWSADGPGSTRPRDRVDVTIESAGVALGYLAVDGDAVAGGDDGRRQLLAEVADSLAPVLEADRLGIQLERQLGRARARAEEIAAARRRMVDEVDAERERLERDLHDGVQHHLVTLRLVLGLVEHEATTGAVAAARTHLAQVRSRWVEAGRVLRATASGKDSVLMREGLSGALARAFASAHPPVVTTVDPVLARVRPAPEAESAVYYCCLEAVNNARKHAPGSPVEVAVDLSGEQVRFWVTDHGPGFTAKDVDGPGRGLRNLRARALELGGDLVVRSSPGAGTRVEGRVPMVPGDDPSGLAH